MFMPVLFYLFPGNGVYLVANYDLRDDVLSWNVTPNSMWAGKVFFLPRTAFTLNPSPIYPRHPST